MNIKERIQYETLKKVLETIEFQIKRIDSKIEIHFNNQILFYYLIGAKIELIELRNDIEENIAHYRKTIFKTKNYNYEQTN
jgi:hypothetical protein